MPGISSGTTSKPRAFQKPRMTFGTPNYQGGLSERYKSRQRGPDEPHTLCLPEVNQQVRFGRYKKYKKLPAITGRQLNGYKYESVLINHIWRQGC